VHQDAGRSATRIVWSGASQQRVANLPDPPLSLVLP